jgi:hypothetical protein
MSERKVLNKYIPPDFDPSQLPKGKRPKVSHLRSITNQSFPPPTAHHMYIAVAASAETNLCGVGMVWQGGQVTVRIMLPMSVQCSSCNEYVYKGTFATDAFSPYIYTIIIIIIIII